VKKHHLYLQHLNQLAVHHCCCCCCCLCQPCLHCGQGFLILAPDKCCAPCTRLVPGGTCHKQARTSHTQTTNNTGRGHISKQCHQQQPSGMRALRGTERHGEWLPGSSHHRLIHTVPSTPPGGGLRRSAQAAGAASKRGRGLQQRGSWMGIV
jgi:hypothetical protein